MVFAVVVALLVVAGAATSGVGGALVTLGVAALLPTVAALLVGRARWALMPSRRAGAIGLGAALTLVLVGGLLAPPPPPEPVTASAVQAEDDAAAPDSHTTTAPSTSPTPLPPATPAPPATTAAAASTPTPDAEAPDTGPAARQAGSGPALAALRELAVKGRAPKTGYDRDVFGPPWADADRNGCDTRNDTLRRDLTATTVDPGTRGCVVLAGRLVDPYSGVTIGFRRGEDTSVDVQIDHVVALSDAWQKGARAWPAGRRLAFANDPLNLLAVNGGLNAAKGDGDAATWLPPRKAFRCAYVARQTAVKAKYGLWVTPAERDAIARVLAGCPGQGLPSSSAPTTAPIAPPAPRQAPAPGAEVGRGDLDCADFTTQPEAQAVLDDDRSDPHRLDGDDDGVACKNLPGGGHIVDGPDSPTSDSDTGATARPRPATDPQFGTCTEALASGYGPYLRGSDPEYDWYRDGDDDGVVCER